MKRKWLFAVVLGGCLLAGTVAMAQLSVPPGRWWEREMVAKELALTQEQKVKLEAVTLEHAKRMIDLKASVDKAELDLRAAADVDPFNPRQVRESFSSFQQARSRLESERFEMLLKVREIVTVEQWRKLRDLAQQAGAAKREQRREELQPPPFNRRPIRRK
jgi:Spy/CpxP family protein refolding chaperone